MQVPISTRLPIRFNFFLISVTLTAIDKTLVTLVILGGLVLPRAHADGVSRERPKWLPRSVSMSPKTEETKEAVQAASPAEQTSAAPSGTSTKVVPVGAKSQREPLKETGRRLENDPAILDKLRVILKEGIPAQMTVDVPNRQGIAAIPGASTPVTATKTALKPRTLGTPIAGKTGTPGKALAAGCENTERTTPVHIRTEDAIELSLEQPVFHYGPLTGDIVNNGQMIEVLVTGHHMLSLRGESYQLKSFHFHNPAQDSIDDQRYPMVMHAVHTNAHGRTLELIVPIDWGEPNPLMTALWGRLPTLKNDRYPVRAGQWGLATLLPEQRSYFVFSEQPNRSACAEQPVTYVFMENPLKASPEQIRAFKALYPDNLQASVGRLVFKSK